MIHGLASTLAEKIIARASGRGQVRPGETLVCRVDLAMIHDSGGPRRVAPKLAQIGAQVWDAERVVVVSDHFTPAADAESARILKLTRDWVRETGAAHFYDMQGICHVVLPEHGHLWPGMFAAGGDSHSTTGGAFGCFMAGYGATDMAGVLASGEVWITTPETLQLWIGGALAPGVSAKDLMLHLCASLGTEHNGQVIEYAGPALAEMSISERMVLTNMAAELGADTALIAPDARTLAALRATGREPPEALRGTDAQIFARWRSDADAPAARAEVDAGALAPQVAAPHSPANSDAVGACAGAAIHQAYIGACVGAKLDDLHMAAAVLRGRRVARDCRLLVAPASARTTSQAAADGTLATLTKAGAILLPSGCGACAGLGAGLLADGEICISTTNRNFRGRMGSPNAEVYLASPYTVAASAVAGCIADPRPLLAERGARGVARPAAGAA